MTRYCPKCRGEFQDWVRNCIDCGTPLVDYLPEPEPEPEAKRSYQPVELVTVAAFAHWLEAEVCRAKLESEGIDSIIVYDNTYGSRWKPEGTIGGIRLQVREEDADLAREILNDVPEGDTTAETVEIDTEVSEEVEAESYEEETEEMASTDSKDVDSGRCCPVCRSTDIETGLVGAVAPFLRTKKKCRRCFHEWH